MAELIGRLFSRRPSSKQMVEVLIETRDKLTGALIRDVNAAPLF